jgi:hypothetical protein
MSERRPKENNSWIKIGSRRRICAVIKLDNFTDECYDDVRIEVFYQREHVIR